MAEQERDERRVKKEEKKQYSKLRKLLSPGNPHTKYLKLKKIANGGSGGVFHGKQINRGKKKAVAIKVMPLKWYEGTDMIKDRFINEISIHKKYPHRHIVKYLDSYIVGRKVWLVTEHVDGVSLHDVVNYATITPCHMAVIGKKVLAVLDHLHRNNIIHRDVTCSNILLGKDGCVKVIDLGLATQDTGYVCELAGTTQWMSPELLNNEVYDCGVDIWAFGITMISMLTGKPPYDWLDDNKDVENEIKQNRRPPIPDEEEVDPLLQEVLDQCLHMDKKERASARDLLKHPFFTTVQQSPSQLIKQLVSSTIEEAAG